VSDKPEKEKPERPERSEKREKKARPVAEADATASTERAPAEASAEPGKGQGKGRGKAPAASEPAAAEAAAPVAAAEAAAAGGEARPEKEKKDGKRWRSGHYSLSKRYRDASSRVDRNKVYQVSEAFSLLKSLPPAKFVETVECVVRLGIDPKKTDQLVRGAVSLPHGLGKQVRVVVFAEGDRAKDAQAAGADVVGSADLAKRVEDGWTDFDVAIASPDMMKFVGKLGRILGPQGKMPSPKAGTVTPDVGTAVREFKAGKVEFRTDAGASVQAPIGKRSFSVEQLVDNARAFVDHVRGLRPSTVKGAFISKVVVSTTMGPGIRVDLVEGGPSA
jgi:large subunit ribosomal protein L1